MREIAVRESIASLKRERDAVILAHNYQRPEVQDIADFAGDSLELARKARRSDARVVVFCGVHFMAETAALLSPEKIILLPDENAGCPMADMADASAVLEMKGEHPGAVVICYVNSTAAVKAVSDACCTSSNAANIVARVPRDREIIFVPDRYLGAQVMKVSRREMHLWPGYCPVHNKLSADLISRGKEIHPGAVVMVHPECVEEVCDAADQVLSTGGMCSFAAGSDAAEFIVGTEPGLLHRLRKENPSKRFIPMLEEAVCPDMKLCTLEKIRDALDRLSPIIVVDESTAKRAAVSVMRMFEDGPITPVEEL